MSRDNSGSHGRRRHQRRLAFPLGASTAGKIFVDAAFIRNCTLHDLSRAGACLRVHEPYDIPEMFDLVLEALGVKKGCRIVWRSKDKIGVTFEAGANAA
jgi:hypothetical protein